MQPSEVADATRISLQEIKALGSASSPCVSILIPTESAPGQTRQNQVRLRHGIEKAKGLLSEKGIEARPFVERIEAIVGHLQLSGEGLAVYCSPDVCRAFELSATVSDAVMVGDHFYVTPLIPLLDADRPFYILALSQKHPRLLRCEGRTAVEVALPEPTPKSLWDDKQSDQPDHEQEGHSSGGPDQGGMKGVSFSTNTDSERHLQYLAHFYKHVSEGVAELLKGEAAPVVIAGVDYEIAAFRRVNAYPHLVEDAVHGSADGLKGGELHKRALEAMQTHWRKPLEAALARYDQLAGSDRGCSKIKEIVAAAFDGRILELVVGETARYIGNFEESTHVVKGRKEPADGDEDLLNAAALQTLLHAGQVFVVPSAQVPHGAPAVAVFRW